MTPGEDLRRQPFDHYARHRLAAEVISRVGARRVVDVGGGPGSLAAHLPAGVHVMAVDVTVPDRWHHPAPRLVVADGARLPLADGTADIVVSLDALEHVPPVRRDAVLDEAVRVSAGWVLVVCPCATPGVVEADTALRSYVAARFPDGFPTVQVLDEHLDLTHPDPAAVRARLERGGAQVAVLPSGRLDRWLPMMIAFHHLLLLGDDDIVERLQAWYNPTHWRDDLREPAYRHAFLARLPGAAGPPAAQVASALLPDGPSPTPDATGLQALQAVLADGAVTLAGRLQAELRTQTEQAHTLRRERDDAAAAAAAARQQAADAAARAAAAEQHAAALAAFREQVLGHPLMRVRRALRRLLPGRSGSG